jgi:hypothetical protein
MDQQEINLKIGILLREYRDRCFNAGYYSALNSPRAQDESDRSNQALMDLVKFLEGLFAPGQNS